MSLTQTAGLIVLVAVAVRVCWWFAEQIAYARHERRDERRRAELNRFIKSDYQRDAQIARLREMQGDARRDDE
jgi:hypothetical protein